MPRELLHKKPPSVDSTYCYFHISLKYACRNQGEGIVVCNLSPSLRFMQNLIFYEFREIMKS